MRVVPQAVIAGLGIIGAVDGAGQLVENHSIGLPSMVGVITTVVIVVLYLERKFANRDRQLAERDQALEHRLTQIEDSLKDLACVRDKLRDFPNKEDCDK